MGLTSNNLYRKTKSIAIYGFARTTRGLIQNSTAEIWTLNNAYEMDVPMERVTRWYEMHQPEQISEAHRAWLQHEHPFEIYTLDNYPKHIIDQYGYFTNSIAYMLAHAIYDLSPGDRIELYGVDMAGGTEYLYQKACTEYYIGIARGKGLTIYLPPGSKLLSAPLYGYDTDAQYMPAEIVKQHQKHYTAERDKSEGERYLFFDGAQAQMALMLNRFVANGSISRHNIDIEARKIALTFTASMRDYNFNAGVMHANNVKDSKKHQELLQTIYRVDGALQAMKNLLAHLDMRPYSLEIETSIK